MSDASRVARRSFLVCSFIGSSPDTPKDSSSCPLASETFDMLPLLSKLLLRVEAAGEAVVRASIFDDVVLSFSKVVISSGSIVLLLRSLFFFVALLLFFIMPGSDRVVCIAVPSSSSSSSSSSSRSRSSKSLGSTVMRRFALSCLSTLGRESDVKKSLMSASPMGLKMPGSHQMECRIAQKYKVSDIKAYYLPIYQKVIAVFP